MNRSRVGLHSIGLVAAVVGLLGEASGAGGQILRLDEVIGRALATYPASALASAERAGAEAELSQARAARVPPLALEAGGTRFQESMIVAPLHSFDPQSAPRFDRLLIQGRVQASYTLWDGGARGAAVRRGQALVEVAGALEEGTSALLIERAVRSYLDVGSSRDIVASNGARIAALEEERARTERMLNAGSVPQVAVLRVQAALSGAVADMASARAAVRRAEAELARLVGAAADSLAAVSLQQISLTSIAGPTRSGLIERAASRDPAVEAALGRVAAASASTDLARASYWPVVSLNGGYNLFGSGAGDFISEWQAAVRLSYPLFTGGARSAAVDRASAASAAAVAVHRQAQLDAQSAVDDALARLAEATARAEALTVAVDQFEAVVDIEALSLTAGAGVQTDYLRAVSDLTDARAALTRARAAAVAARVTLARMTGDLDLDWLARNLEVQ